MKLIATYTNLCSLCMAESMSCLNVRMAINELRQTIALKVTIVQKKRLERDEHVVSLQRSLRLSAIRVPCNSSNSHTHTHTLMSPNNCSLVCIWVGIVPRRKPLSLFLSFVNEQDGFFVASFSSSFSKLNQSEANAPNSATTNCLYLNCWCCCQWQIDCTRSVVSFFSFTFFLFFTYKTCLSLFFCRCCCWLLFAHTNNCSLLFHHVKNSWIIINGANDLTSEFLLHYNYY